MNTRIPATSVLKHVKMGPVRKYPLEGEGSFTSWISEYFWICLLKGFWMRLRSLALAIAGVVSVSFAAASSASADDFFNFNWSDVAGGAAATGVFDTTANGDGSFTVVGVTGVQTLGGATSSIASLATFASANQKLYPSAAAPLDFSGISYATATLGDFNLAYDNGLVRISSTEDPGGYASGEHAITFATTPVTGGVPEPSAWALMILGFGGVGSMLRRKRLVPA